MKEHDNTMVQELFENLQVNMKLSEDVLNILEDEAVSLKEMDTAKLLRISKQKGNLFIKMQYIDNSIEQSIAQLEKTISAASQSPGPGNTPQPIGKLGRLAKILPSDKAQTVYRYKDTLFKLRQKIADRNLVNKRFTEDTLGFLGEAISMITGPARATNTTYSYSGISQPSSSLPSMISREV